MEVHHHSHTARKKWTHYFWEFLMLFLAVFCGFLAENIREHKIERDREKQFIKSLISDLEKDTANLNEYIKDHKFRFSLYDSLLTLLSTGDYGQHSGNCYYYARYLSRGNSFQPTDGTLQQLKNSGGLRLIRKRDVVDSLLAYELRTRNQISLDERNGHVQQRFQEIANEVFDGSVLYKMVDSSFNIIRPSGNPLFINTSPETINKVIVRIQYMTIGTNKKRIDAEALLTKAEKLVLFIKKEYHLK